MKSDNLDNINDLFDPIEVVWQKGAYMIVDENDNVLNIISEDVWESASLSTKKIMVEGIINGLLIGG